MQPKIQIKQFENGMTLIAEPMPWLQSASFSFSLPNGCRYDPKERLGLASFTSEMVQRGCGDLDSRGYIEQLDSLGVDYASSVSVYHTHFSGSLPAPQLFPTLRIYADVLRRPRLPKEQLEDARLVCVQDIRSVEDDLSQRVMLELRARQYGDPLGRASHGTYESIAAITQQDIIEFVDTMYHPNGTILSVAGNIVWEDLCQIVEELFDDWQPRQYSSVESAGHTTGVHHIQFDSQQTHIGLAYPAVAYADESYFVARGAVGVLSDGMSSRLFTEIREKRGLCYTVYASLHTLKDRGSVFSYVGTGADRAQQSLDVLCEQLFKLSEGIAQDELDRLKIQIRSSLVMQQESSRSRASSISADFFHLGYARSLNQINRLINDLTIDRINEYLISHPPHDFNLVTLGSEPLELKHAVPSTTTG